MSLYRGFEHFLIGSAWAKPLGDRRHNIVNPANGKEIGTVRLASEGDIDAAVQAGHEASENPAWTNLPVDSRAEMIRAVKEYCTGQIDRLVELSATEVGMPTSQSRGRHMAALTYFDEAIALATSLSRAELRPDSLTGRFSLINREPVGLVAAITPFNSPFAMGVNKTARALMAGCPVVFKPSPEGSLHAEVLAEAYQAAGFPPGAVSVLPGDAEMGSKLVGDPRVAMVTFTGSTAAGRAIAKRCAANFTRSNLELGGKSAAIICDDADMDVVMAYLPIGCFGNAGQICVTLSRIYVHRSLFDTLVERLKAAAEALAPGDPADDATGLGPIVSRRQLERIDAIVRGAVEAGAKIVTGGRPIDRDGFFFQPTIVTNVENSAAVVQDEIFGPVTVVLPFGSDDEAVRLANDSNFGLHGAVFTRDVERGLRLTGQIKTGTIALNGYGITSNAPFGGVKWSGWGRENGPEGMEEYFEFKSTLLDPATAKSVGLLHHSSRVLSVIDPSGSANPPGADARINPFAQV